MKESVVPYLTLVVRPRRPIDSRFVYVPQFGWETCRHPLHVDSNLTVGWLYMSERPSDVRLAEIINEPFRAIMCVLKEVVHSSWHVGDRDECKAIEFATEQFQVVVILVPLLLVMTSILTVETFPCNCFIIDLAKEANHPWLTVLFQGSLLLENT